MNHESNFNPRLREGGDEEPSGDAQENTEISIHASAKEATQLGGETEFNFGISIHASAKEATLVPDCPTGEQKFQSTPPRRRRRLMSDIKEATQDFNPRLREGGDICRGKHSGIRCEFQSTPPRRRRRLNLLYLTDR